jgi:NAD-dependent DNA ligase
MPQALSEQWHALQQLTKLGFGSGVAEHASLVGSLEEAVAAGAKLLADRAALPFETDGCVLKVNCIKARSCPMQIK